MTERAGISPAGEPTDFEGCLRRVNPSTASLQQLAAQPDESPFLMLNLLRFRPRGDSTIYSLYGREAAPEIRKVNSFVGCFGKTVTGLPPELGFDTSWDSIALMIYHRRRSFLQLQESSRYQLAIPYRSAGTSRRTLYAISDGDSLVQAATRVAALDQERIPLPLHNADICVIELMRFNDGSQRKRAREERLDKQPLLLELGAQCLLASRAEVPVLSEHYWSDCLIYRFTEAASLEQFYRATRSFGESCLRVAAQPAPLPT